MKELEQILWAHSRRYPAMEPTDAVKLIYQNEFGGGHMISDEERCMAFLRREYAAVAHRADAPLWEDIGNGIVRVHLAAVKPEQVDQLGRAFIRSAQNHPGERSRFLEKLALLEQLTAAGAFSFDSHALKEYLEAYARAGYPPVSHSEAYRAAYHPAYRIVSAALFSEK